jgi:hypothetical protein
MKVENHIMIPCDASIVDYHGRVCLCARYVYIVSFLRAELKVRNNDWKMPLILTKIVVTLP